MCFIFLFSLSFIVKLPTLVHMKRIISMTAGVAIASLVFAGIPHAELYGEEKDATAPVSNTATVAEESVSITNTMREQGFSHIFDEARLSVSVPQQTLAKTSSLKTSRTMSAAQAVSFMVPPTGMSLGSSVYVYDFGKEAQGDVAKDITLSLAYSGTDPNAYIAFYDRNKKKWRGLNSHIKNGRIQTTTRLPFSQIAVLERRLWLTDSGVDLWAIPAKAVYVVDQKGNVLLAKNSSQKLSIASITKLMTALVFLDHNPGWNKSITFTAADDTIPSKYYLKVGDQITVKDAFYGALVGSKNNATKMLARSTGLTKAQFVQKMNEKAKVLGMKDTVFVEPTGLDEGNMSTAKDLAILSQEAYKQFAVLQAATTKTYGFHTLKYDTAISTKNSNALLGKIKEIRAGKTGYTEEAGFSMVAQGEKNNETLTVVLLGAPDDATRFDVVGKLVQLAMKNGKFTFRIAGL